MMALYVSYYCFKQVLLASSKHWISIVVLCLAWGSGCLSRILVCHCSPSVISARLAWLIMSTIPRSNLGVSGDPSLSYNNTHWTSMVSVSGGKCCCVCLEFEVRVSLQAIRECRLRNAVSLRYGLNRGIFAMFRVLNCRIYCYVSCRSHICRCGWAIARKSRGSLAWCS